MRIFDTGYRLSLNCIDNNLLLLNRLKHILPEIDQRRPEQEINGYQNHYNEYHNEDPFNQTLTAFIW